MSSIFSFLQPSAAGEPQPATPASGTPGIDLAAAMMISPSKGLDMSKVLLRMLEHLSGFLPRPVAELPKPSVIIINLNDVPVGVGNFIGEQRHSPFGQVVVKGGRLEANVRFTLWSDNQPHINDAILALQARLLAANSLLSSLGFLRFSSLTSSDPSFDATLAAWGRNVDYSLLYEYRYLPTDDAQSLIARIPIAADQETLLSPERETTTITDKMARWDDQTAPALVVRGPGSSTSLAALAFAPTVPTGAVTLTRTFDRSAGPPTHHPSLAAFLGALADPIAPQRHAQVTFATFTDFLAQFSPLGEPLTLGDWDLDGVLDEYQGFELALSPSITLPAVFDRLEVTYGNGAEPLDQTTVVYLRLKP